MSRKRRRSGLSLVLSGVLGLAFFWLTDPRHGWGMRWAHGDNAVDLANQNFDGTLVGLAGSLIVLAMGLWLLTRRTA